MFNTKTILHVLAKHTSHTFERELILAHTIKKPREFVIAHPEYTVSKIQEIQYLRSVKKLEHGHPLAYITGHKEFYGLDFLVNTYTLVPRPETELLVELAIDKIKEQRTPPEAEKSTEQHILCIDVGTGSGCIPIAIQKIIEKEQKTKNNKKSARYFATDISKNALSIAKKNAKKHTADITFLHGNLLEPVMRLDYSLLFAPYLPADLSFVNLTKKEALAKVGSLIITANLPYLTEEQFDSEPSIQKEPRSALVAKDNGLALYKKLLLQIKQTQHLFFVPCSLFFEIDPSQAIPISQFSKQIFPKSIINIHKDLRGQERVVEITLQ